MLLLTPWISAVLRPPLHTAPHASRSCRPRLHLLRAVRRQQERVETHSAAGRTATCQGWGAEALVHGDALARSAKVLLYLLRRGGVAHLRQGVTRLLLLHAGALLRLLLHVMLLLLLGLLRVLVLLRLLLLRHSWPMLQLWVCLLHVLRGGAVLHDGPPLLHLLLWMLLQLLLQLRLLLMSSAPRLLQVLFCIVRVLLRMLLRLHGARILLPQLPVKAAGAHQQRS